MTELTPPDHPMRDEAGERIAAGLAEFRRLKTHCYSDEKRVELALRAAVLSPAPASGGVDVVAVKALRWAPASVVGCEIAESAAGRYSVLPAVRGGDDAIRPAAWIDPRGDEHPAVSVEAAKAAAQADYEQRIRSALSPAATPVSEAGGETERLKADVERLTQERDQARCDYEQEADWSKTVDQHGLDGFDDLAARWLKVDAIQRMHNAAASVFAKWSNDELMGRFKAHMTRIMHTAFVEGAIVGVRTALAKPAGVRRVRHKKRGGIYEVLGEAQVQTSRPLEDYEVVVIYRSLNTPDIDDPASPMKGDTWARPKAEFNDGRFEELSQSTSAGCGGWLSRHDICRLWQDVAVKRPNLTVTGFVNELLWEIDDRPAGHVRIQHDGFAGDIIGHYLTREGKQGVVVQQDDTRVVHVYGEKWLATETEGR